MGITDLSEGYGGRVAHEEDLGQPEGGDVEEGRGARLFPSKLLVHLYLVVGIAALIVNSRFETDTVVRYALGIGVEVALALLAVLFTRLEKLRTVETLRLRRPETRSVLLALAAVPGLWMTGVMLNVLSALIFGYTTPAPPAQFPRNAIEAVLLALTAVVVAPLCEEIMFRGYVQRAYERGGIWAGIAIGGLVFALYHLRFQGVFALIPVALALGYIAWRTESVLTGMAVHAAYNAIATVLLITSSFLPMRAAGAITGTLICLGALLTPLSFAALWLLGRRTRPGKPPTAPSQRRFLRWAWVLPAVALVGIYGYAALSEFAIYRFPERFLDGPIEITKVEAWQEPVTWRYAVQNTLGRDLGEATCRVTPAAGTEASSFTLACEADYEGFDLTDELPGVGDLLEGISLDDLPFDVPGLTAAFEGEAQTWELTASWSDVGVDLVSFEASRTTPSLGALQLRYSSQEGAGTLVVEDEGAGTSVMDIPTHTVLMPNEWAWRLSGLPFELPYGGDATLVQIDRTGEARLVDAFVEVAGGEPTWAPAGNYVTWRVVVRWTDEAGDKRALNAWYDSEPPHTLVRYEDGTVSYILSSIETVSAE